MFGSEIATNPWWWLEGVGFMVVVAIVYYVIHRNIDKLVIDYEDGEEDKREKEKFMVGTILFLSCLVVGLLVMTIVLGA